MNRLHHRPQPSALMAMVAATALVTVQAAAAQPAPAATAQNNTKHIGSYLEAVRCASLASAFKDGGLAQRWAAVESEWLGSVSPTMSGSLRSSTSMDAAMDYATDKKAANLALDRCQSRITAAETEAKEERGRQLSQFQAEKQRAAAGFAPLKVSEVDRISIKVGGPVSTKLKQEGWAWYAYCVVASETLVNVTQRSPAAFALDPRQHGEIFSDIRKWRDLQKAKFVELFKIEERPFGEQMVQTQSANYSRGWDQRKGNEKALVEFIKQQVFECSDTGEYAMMWQANLLKATLNRLQGAP